MKDEHIPTSDEVNMSKCTVSETFASDVTVGPEALKPSAGDRLELSEAVASSAPLCIKQWHCLYIHVVLLDFVLT